MTPRSLRQIYAERKELIAKYVPAETQAIHAQKWIHATVRYPEGGDGTMWLSPDQQIWALRLNDSSYFFYSGRERVKYEYVPSPGDRSVTKLPLGEDSAQRVLSMNALSQGKSAVGHWLIGIEKILSVSEKGFGKQTTVDSYRLTKRGGIGVINMKTTEKTGKVVAAFPVEDDSEIMIITQQAKLIRLGVDKIRETGRSAQGVTLIKCGDDDLVTSASLLAVDEEDD